MPIAFGCDPNCMSTHPLHLSDTALEENIHVLYHPHPSPPTSHSQPHEVDSPKILLPNEDESKRPWRWPNGSRALPVCVRQATVTRSRIFFIIVSNSATRDASAWNVACCARSVDEITNHVQISMNESHKWHLRSLGDK